MMTVFPKIEMEYISSKIADQSKEKEMLRSEIEFGSKETKGKNCDRSFQEEKQDQEEIKKHKILIISRECIV